MDIKILSLEKNPVIVKRYNGKIKIDSEVYEFTVIVVPGWVDIDWILYPPYLQRVEDIILKYFRKNFKTND